MEQAITKEHYDRFAYPRPENYIAPNGKLGSNVHMGAVECDTLVVGCGTIQALLIARDSPNFLITGIDTSTTSLEWARAQAKKEKIANVELIEANVCNFKYTKSFRHVIASCVLHHIPEIDEALNNIKTNLLDPNEKSSLYGHVYKKKHRGHILQTRKMLQATGRKTCDEVRTYLLSLNEYHPSRIWFNHYGKDDNEIADTWLNPYAVHYDQKKWINVLGRNGFTYVKWEKILRPKSGLMGWWAW